MRYEILSFSEDIRAVLSKVTDCISFGLIDKETGVDTFRAMTKALNALDASLRPVIPTKPEETASELERRRQKYETQFLKFEKAVAELHETDKMLTDLLIASGRNCGTVPG
jgi:hypothetical protein